MTDWDTFDHYIDEAISPETISGFFIRLIVIGIPVDIIFLNGVGTNYLLEISRNFGDVITLLFSGLLVILYLDQHKTQQRQVEIAQKQAEIQEKQTAMEREKNRPEIIIDDITVNDPEAEGERPNIRPIILGLVLENVGKGKAQDLEIGIDLFFSQEEDDQYHYFPLQLFGINNFGGPLFSDVSDEDVFGLDPKGTRLLSPGEVKIFSGRVLLSYTPFTGPAEKEPAEHAISKSTIPGQISDTLGEAIEYLEFEVTSVMIRVYIEYEDFSGTEMDKTVLQRKLEAEECDNVMQLIEEGESLLDSDYHVTNPDHLTSRYYLDL